MNPCLTCVENEERRLLACDRKRQPWRPWLGILALVVGAWAMRRRTNG